jgi:hypothetical protein
MEDGMDRPCSMHGENYKCVHKVFVGKQDGKRRLGIGRLRWEDDIKIELKRLRVWGSGLD